MHLPQAPKNIGGDNLMNLPKIFYSSMEIYGWETTSWATTNWETRNVGGTSTLGVTPTGCAPTSVLLYTIDHAPSNSTPLNNPKILTKESLCPKEEINLVETGMEPWLLAYVVEERHAQRKKYGMAKAPKAFYDF